MADVVRFKAKLSAPMPGVGSWTFLEIPPSVSKRFGTKARVQLSGTVNGYRVKSNAMPDGNGGHSLTFNKTMREGAQAEAGDTVTCELKVDRVPPKVTVPKDLKEVLAEDPEAAERWDAFTAIQRRDYVAWIVEAKRPETRAKRLRELVTRVRKGIKRFD